MALISVAEALQQVLGDLRAPATGERETVALVAARGRYLAEDQVAGVDVPPAANSAMDGYAVNAAAVASLDVIPVTQRIAAGQVGSPLAPGTAARIFTGAELPPGADTVVMQEDCAIETDGIRIRIPLEAGDNVRPQGQDIRFGTRLLAAGERLEPVSLALLASVGIGSVPVFRPLRVAVLSTGDELIEPGEAVGPGQIYNSNRTLLTAMVAALGFEPVDLGRVADTPAAVEAALLAAAQRADCIVSSGGVSAGEEDHVRGALERLGELRLWKIAMKPGKPLAYGRLENVPFFGLPGNPVSTFVTFKLFVEPYLRQLQTGLAWQAPRWRVRAAFNWPRAGKREEYLRVQLRSGHEGLEAALFANQSSGVLTSVAWANALARVPIGATLAVGDWVDVVPLN